MFSSENVLQQTGNMRFIECYLMKEGYVAASPVFRDLAPGEIVPVCMWIESIGQCGEICCRNHLRYSGPVLLIRCSNIRLPGLRKEESSAISYSAHIQEVVWPYVTSEVSVSNRGIELFRCAYVYYFSGGKKRKKWNG